MPRVLTTSDYFQKLRESGAELKSALLNFDVPCGQSTKINTLVGLVHLIDTGIGYMCATFVSNKTSVLTISGIDFIPHSFAISSLYAISHEYSVTSSSFKVIGAISIDELELGEHTYTVDMLANELELTSIEITVNLTQSNNQCSLIVTLPSTYYFLGENEYAMLGNTHEEDQS